MTANSLNGPWSPTAKLSNDMSKVAEDPHFAELKPMIPPPAVSNGVIPLICYSNRPAEMILFDGKPVYSQIPETQLVYSTNTSSYLFRHTGSHQFLRVVRPLWS